MYELGVQSENFKLIKPLLLWINDGLMAVFFFMIGLEIKREVLIGELNSFKKSSLPVFAAIGGMLVPFLFYIFLNKNPETESGWGIPMATDIAFSLAILHLLGKRVPLGLKIFLTAFAIIDDIGAVLVIAIFYTSDISWVLLLYAGILLLALYILSYKQIYNKYLLVIFGIVVWILFLKSGIHPTIAGILLAFSVPVRQRINEHAYAEKLRSIVDNITGSDNTNELPVLTDKQIEEIDNLDDWTAKVQSPLQHLEHKLHYWVAYLIMPLFAFANAGVRISSDGNTDIALAVTIALSLFLGKTIGVFLFSYFSIKFKFASLPDRVNYTSILGIAVLSGVGFTMSLFIGNLAFQDATLYLNSAKIGIIAGSVLSGVLGYIFIKYASRRVS